MNLVICHVDNSRFKLLSGLSLSCLQKLLSPVVKVRHKTHTNLVFPGDPIEHIYLIEKGWVKIYRLNEQGQESISSMVGPGESVMADMLLYKHPSPFGATTTTECEFLLLPASHARHVLQTHPEFALKLVEEVSTSNLNRMHLIEQITVQPALERVGTFLLMAMLEHKRQPSNEFDLPYGKSEIAHYLNLTPATFSRCLKLLAQQGIVALARHIQQHTLTSLCTYCDAHTALKCRRFGELGFCRQSLTVRPRRTG